MICRFWHKCLAKIKNKNVKYHNKKRNKMKEEDEKLKSAYTKELNQKNSFGQNNYEKEEKGFTINIPKKENKGEDADPILFCNDSIYCVGVFDGMGGSGATEYQSQNGNHTGAYIASRRVKKTCEDFIRKVKSFELNIEELSKKIKEELTKAKEEIGIKSSALRSSIIRTLPTTMAIVTAEKREEDILINSYWCGDSRNYILTKDGLKQISIDDLVNPQDPLENLRNDEALSNCISQDKSFEIRCRYCGCFREPIIIISATDGCFGYLKTPMHFEYVLLESLMKSNNCKEWENYIIKYLQPISGDDFSLSLSFISNGSLAYWKNILKERFNFIKEHFIHPIELIEYEIIELEDKLENSKKDLYNEITILWESYKTQYMYKD